MVLDLGILRKRAERVSVMQAFWWTLFWISCALLYNYYIYAHLGSDAAIEFFTGYIIEYSLSVDNLFVFLVLFSYFNVPEKYQQRVLFFGILGAILMRGFFIFAGAALITRFHWIIYIFGIILLFSGIKLMFHGDEKLEPEKSVVFRLAKRFLPLVPEYHGDHFFVRKGERHFATPLFLVLLSVEFTDLIFAVDSIPAIFAITKDPLIVFTSNIFAVLGLRSLFFLLSGSMGKIEYLQVGLALILCFVGIKMLIESYYKIPNLASLAVIITILSGAVVASLIARRSRERSEA